MGPFFDEASLMQTPPFQPDPTIIAGPQDDEQDELTRLENERLAKQLSQNLGIPAPQTFEVPTPKNIPPGGEQQAQENWFRKYLAENSIDKRTADKFSKYWKKKGFAGKAGTAIQEFLRGAQQGRQYVGPKDRFRAQATKEFQEETKALTGIERLEKLAQRHQQTQQRLWQNQLEKQGQAKDIFKLKKENQAFEQGRKKAEFERNIMLDASRMKLQDAQTIRALKAAEKSMKPSTFDQMLYDTYDGDVGKVMASKMAMAESEAKMKAVLRQKYPTKSAERGKYLYKETPTSEIRFDPKQRIFTQGRLSYRLNKDTGEKEYLDEFSKRMANQPVRSAKARDSHEGFAATMEQARYALGQLNQAGATEDLNLFGIYDTSIGEYLRNLGFMGGVSPMEAVIDIATTNESTMHGAGMVRFRPSMEMIQKLIGSVGRSPGTLQAKVAGQLGLIFATELAMLNLELGDTSGFDLSSAKNSAKLRNAMTGYTKQVLNAQRKKDPSLLPKGLPSLRELFKDEIAASARKNPLQSLQQGSARQKAINEVNAIVP